MKKLLTLCLCLCLLATLVACAAKPAVEGLYEAVDPPEASGETVIKSLRFSGNQVTMVSGDIEQTVNYTMDEHSFAIHTKYGDFTYDCQKQADGSLLIDGVTYQPR